MKNYLLVLSFVIAGLILSTPLFSAEGDEKSLSESFMEKYTLAETLELGVQGLFPWQALRILMI